MRIDGYHTDSGEPRYVSACLNMECCYGGAHIVTRPPPRGALQRLLTWARPTPRCPKCNWMMDLPEDKVWAVNADNHTYTVKVHESVMSDAE